MGGKAKMMLFKVPKDFNSSQELGYDGPWTKLEPTPPQTLGRTDNQKIFNVNLEVKALIIPSSSFFFP